MTRTLILTRHAKSDWDDPTVDDHDRPLNARGLRSAAALGRWLAAAGWRPGEALVSTALRARQTWEGISAELPDPPAARLEERLYHARPDTMLEVLRTATAPSVILVGHNPGIAAFAADLAAAPPEHPRFGDYPTGATTVLRFDIDSWRDAGRGSGTVAGFVIPRDLD